MNTVLGKVAGQSQVNPGAVSILVDQGQVIGFEAVGIQRGQEFLAEVYEAILGKRPLRATYQSFKWSEAATRDFSPYYLKAYNRRWYLLGFMAGPEQCSDKGHFRRWEKQNYFNSKGIGYPHPIRAKYPYPSVRANHFRPQPCGLTP